MLRAAALGLPLALFAPLLWSGRVVYGYDLWSAFVYTTRWVANELRAGRLPVWDPHAVAGYPLIADVQSAVFYPPAWAATILGDAAFWSWVLGAHLVLAGVFAERWLQRGLGLDRRAALVGGLVFALAGFPYLRIVAGHVHYVWAYPWVAAALWRLERWLAGPSLKRAALLAPTLVLMVLAGVPQLALAASLPIAARLVHFVVAGDRAGRRARLATAFGAGAALAVGALLGAPQILPALELARESQRIAVGDVDFVTTFSLPPENLLTLLAPRFFGDTYGAAYWGRWYPWEACGYVGVASLVLAVLGVSGGRAQSRLWAMVAVGALLVALGRYTPVFAVFRTLVPGVELFRGPGRYLYVFVVAVVALAGMGVQRLLDGDAAAARSARRLAIAALAGALVLGAGALVVWLGGSGDSGWWRDVLREAHESRVVEGGQPVHFGSPAFRARTVAVAGWSLATAAGWSAATGLLLLAFGVGRLGAGRAATLCAVLVAVELVSFDARYVRGRDPRALAWPPALAATLERELRGPYRMTTVGEKEVADAGRARALGLDHVGGFESIQLARYSEVLNALEALPLDSQRVIATPRTPHALLDMLGVRVWLVPAETVPGARMRLVRRVGKRAVLVSDGALPRAWIAPRALSLPDPERRLRYLTDGRWDPRSVVVLEDDVERPPAAGARGGGRVELRERAPGEYRLVADSPDGGYLVLSETWYPGWTATVDGTPAEVLRANHLVQAVVLPPGRHEVRFVYRSAPLRAGLAVALGALCTPFAIVLARRLRVRWRTDQRRDNLSNARA